MYSGMDGRIDEWTHGRMEEVSRNVTLLNNRDNADNVVNAAGFDVIGNKTVSKNSFAGTD